VDRRADGANRTANAIPDVANGANTAANFRTNPSDGRTDMATYTRPDIADTRAHVARYASSDNIADGAYTSDARTDNIRPHDSFSDYTLSDDRRSHNTCADDRGSDNTLTNWGSALSSTC
jgi:hypothetical protein